MHHRFQGSPLLRDVPSARAMAAAPRASSGSARSSTARPPSKDPQRQPRPGNVEGDIFVDHTCIDCDTCRWMVPSVFTRVDRASVVAAQPDAPEERHAALQALLACPTHSIHTTAPRAGELQAAQDSFPLPVDACPGVYHVGFHEESSFGATSYLIRRPSGNVLVDVPRLVPALAVKLEELGGVRHMFLTHEDDVADHERWAQRLGAQRIIHRSAVSEAQRTDRAERILEGEGPWQLDDDGGDDGALIIFTPGHTPGCLSLWYPPAKALFTGDHLAWSVGLGRLTIFRRYNWHSVQQQIESVKALAHLDFRHLLPAHGRRYHFSGAQERDSMLQELLQEEEGEGQ